MSVIYQITGYNKQTERLAVEFDVPQDSLQFVMQAAQVSPEQAADYGAVPLSPATIKRIECQLNKSFDSELCDWFLEPFATHSA
jgi:hypothetical protein